MTSDSERDVPMALLDQAFALAKNQPAGREFDQAINVALAQAFPESKPRTIAAATRRARALLDACYTVGEQCRAGMSNEEAVAVLAARCPDFGVGIYHEAVAYGMFISR